MGSNKDVGGGGVQGVGQLTELKEKEVQGHLRLLSFTSQPGLQPGILLENNNKFRLRAYLAVMSQTRVNLGSPTFLKCKTGRNEIQPGRILCRQSPSRLVGIGEKEFSSRDLPWLWAIAGLSLTS